MPASPSPARRMRVPSSTPAGMLTCSVLSLRTRPAPPQVQQGSLITRPMPWQVGQVRSMVKKPCWARTLPAPWQVEQATGWAPPAPPVPLQLSHGAEVGTVMVAVLPLKASSRLISML